jgi:hypothetical protein
MAFRCIAFKNGSSVDLRANSGKPLRRYFPEMVALLAGLPAPDFVIDGELVIEVAGMLSFDALQMRLHPAESRMMRCRRRKRDRQQCCDDGDRPVGGAVNSIPPTRHPAHLASIVMDDRIDLLG